MQSIEEISAAIISSKQELQERSAAARQWEDEQRYKIYNLMSELASARFSQFIEALQTFKSNGSISEEITTKWSHITEEGINTFHKRAEAEGIEGLTLEDFIAFRNALTA